MILALVISFGPGAIAQEVPTNLGDAGSSYGTGDLENTRFALQQALIGINQTIGQEILAILPTSLGGMNQVEGSDDVSGSGVAFAGLFVGREYLGDDSTRASLQVISDSPMLASVNSLLSMSVFFAADPNQKRIKLDGYKALLTRSEAENGLVVYDVNMPFGESMLNVNITGVPEEKKVTGILDEVPVGKIVETAQ